MNAKLIAALFATLIAASAHAEQQFGRDSVYVGKATPSKAPSSGPQITRYGRDSVYITNSAPLKPTTRVTTDFTYKAGRA